MRERIKGFDGIRALAVISVVLTHMNAWRYLEEKGLMSASVIPLLHGSTAVQAFFVLSGFLITTLLIKEHAATGHVSIKNFMIRRALKIFPLYVLFLVLATILHAFFNNVTTWTSLRYAYFYIYNFIPYSVCTGFLEHTWSLSVEEHFYIIWPCLFLVMFSRHRKMVVQFLFLCIPGSILLHYALFNSHFNAEYFVSRWTFISGYNIAAGCAAAILIQTGSNSLFIKSIFKNPCAMAAGLLLYANSTYLQSDYSFVQDVISGYLRSAGIVLIITWLFLNQESFMVKSLEWPPLRYIGVISYGIYMYQGLFLATGPQRDPSQDWPLAQSMGFVLLVVTAPLSYHYFEKPFLRLKCMYVGSNKSFTLTKPVLLTS